MKFILDVLTIPLTIPVFIVCIVIGRIVEAAKLGFALGARYVRDVYHKAEELLES